MSEFTHQIIGPIPFNPSWQQLSPRERIARLESGQKLKIPGFNPRQELVQAVAEVCFEKLKFPNPEHLVNMVTYQGSSAFRRSLIVVSEEYGDSTDRAHLDLATKEVIELVNKSGTMIYINTARLPYFTDAVRTHYPKPSPPLLLATAVEKSLLFHAFSHLPQGDEEITIDPINLTNGTITSFSGYKFKGRSVDGAPFTKTGALEALTDATAHYISEGVGEYYSPPLFKIGRDLLENVLIRAGIMGDEIVQFNNRARTIAELLERINSIKAVTAGGNVGAKVLLFIAFVVGGDIDKRTADVEINKLLRS